MVGQQGRLRPAGQPGYSATAHRVKGSVGQQGCRAADIRKRPSVQGQGKGMGNKGQGQGNKGQG